MLNGRGDLSGLTLRLERARRFYLLRLTIAFGSLAAALVVLSVLVLPGLAQSGVASDGAWRMAVAVVVAGLSAALVVSLANAPGLAALARRADRIFGLGERVSTALDLRPAAPQGLAVAMRVALLRDASQYAARIEPSRLEPVLTPASGLAVVALLLSLCLAWFAPARVIVAPVATTSAEAVTSPVDFEARSANLTAIAEALTREADKRQSGYLGAVAQAVAELARTSGSNASPAQVQAALAGLLDHASLALGANAPAWLRGEGAADDRFGVMQDASFGELARQIEASKPSPMQRGGGGEEIVPELFTERDGGRGAAPAKLAPGEIRTTSDNADLKINSQNVSRENASNAASNGEAKEANSAMAAGSPGNRDGGEAETIDAAAALLAGGAQQSGAGASRVAGNGTQALDAGPSRAMEETGQRGPEVLLPSDNYRRGKKIRIQITPQPSTAEAADGSQPSTGVGGEAEAIAVARDAPPTRDQETFSRMFSHSEGAGAPR